MIPYVVFLVVSFVIWLIYTATVTVEAMEYRQQSDAKKARLAWLSFFLLPLYPAVIVAALIFGPIIIFRQLGRISKEDT